jgi:flagellar biosynthetic protein FlhB
MSATADDDKTEAASAEKLRKARAEGQVARSRDWSTAVGIFVCLQLIALMAPGLLQDFRLLFEQAFASLHGDGVFDDAFSRLLPTTLLLLLKMVQPLLAVPLMIGIGSLFPGGWTWNAGALAPSLDRLTPAAFFKRVFSVKQLVDTNTAILKAVVLLVVLYYVTRSGVAGYLRLQSLPLDEALRSGAALLLHGTMALCSVFIAFAAIDLPVQALVFLRGQRMSKFEVKEEHRTSEGRPEVRRRIRQLQNQIARRTVRKSVPTADVVVVNPEHYAVALKYDEERATAPFVVAKGIDEMAQFIRQVAAEHGVEIVSLPPLARAIYNTSQINQQIPAALYSVVARVLSYVLQIQAFRGGQRTLEPEPPVDLKISEHLTVMTS